ncbi:MAG: DUF5606 domain-containing protein [Lutibacter sp.]|nr:DUF5606 domain-containing protein [Lutibacter sp.]
MDFKDIVAINGKPGLYEIKARSKTGVIVQSLLDDKKFPVNQLQQLSALNEIAIYTYEEEVPLRVVLQNIAEKEGGQEPLSHRENSQKLLAYFREVLPDFDEERVYTSNIKKVLQWYHILAANQVDFSTVEETEKEKAQT